MAVMIDIETLDTQPTAIVLSLGACRFDYNVEELKLSREDVFYTTFNVDEQAQAGRTASWSTIKWWFKQSKEAFQAVSGDDSPPFREALNDFAGWLQREPATAIWGNGSDFDNVILANLYRTAGMEPPWNFWDNRCFRTFKNVHDVLNSRKPAEPKVKHHALQDAIFQAEWLIGIFKKIHEG